MGKAVVQFSQYRNGKVRSPCRLETSSRKKMGPDPQRLQHTPSKADCNPDTSKICAPFPAHSHSSTLDSLELESCVECGDTLSFFSDAVGATEDKVVLVVELMGAATSAGEWTVDYTLAVFWSCRGALCFGSRWCGMTRFGRRIRCCFVLAMVQEGEDAERRRKRLRGEINWL